MALSNTDLRRLSAALGQDCCPALLEEFLAARRGLLQETTEICQNNFSKLYDFINSADSLKKLLVAYREQSLAFESERQSFVSSTTQLEREIQACQRQLESAERLQSLRAVYCKALCSADKIHLAIEQKEFFTALNLVNEALCSIKECCDLFSNKFRCFLQNCRLRLAEGCLMHTADWSRHICSGTTKSVGKQAFSVGQRLSREQVTAAESCSVAEIASTIDLDAFFESFYVCAQLGFSIAFVDAINQQRNSEFMALIGGLQGAKSHTVDDAVSALEESLKLFLGFFLIECRMSSTPGSLFSFERTTERWVEFSAKFYFSFKTLLSRLEHSDQALLLHDVIAPFQLAVESAGLFPLHTENSGLSMELFNSFQQLKHAEKAAAVHKEKSLSEWRCFLQSDFIREEVGFLKSLSQSLERFLRFSKLSKNITHRFLVAMAAKSFSQLTRVGEKFFLPKGDWDGLVSVYKNSISLREALPAEFFDPNFTHEESVDLISKYLISKVSDIFPIDLQSKEHVAYLQMLLSSKLETNFTAAEAKAIFTSLLQTFLSCLWDQFLSAFSSDRSPYKGPKDDQLLAYCRICVESLAREFNFPVYDQTNRMLEAFALNSFDELLSLTPDDRRALVLACAGRVRSSAYAAATLVDSSSVTLRDAFGRLPKA